MEAEKEWKQIKEKYSELPDWKWITHNFKLSVEEDVLLIQQVRFAISEKINYIAHTIIEPFISGMESYRTWIERKMVTKQERDEMFEFYKKLKILTWESTKLAMETTDEKKIAEWIIKLSKEWDELTKYTTKICDKMIDGWKEHEKSEASTMYHG
jgi:hypothetical protein